MLQMPTQIAIDDIEMSVRTYNCLRRAGISTLSELISCSEDEISHFRNLGAKSLEEIKSILAGMNLKLRDDDSAPGSYSSQGLVLNNMPINCGNLRLEPHKGLSYLRDFYHQAFGYDVLRYTTFSSLVRSKFFSSESGAISGFNNTVAEIIMSMGTRLSDVLYYRLGFNTDGKLWDEKETARELFISDAEELRRESEIICFLRSPGVLATMMSYFDEDSRVMAVNSLEKLSHRESFGFCYDTDALRDVMRFRVNYESSDSTAHAVPDDTKAGIIILKLQHSKI